MSRPGTGTDGEMTGQPAVNVRDYVVARHTNGDKIYGEVAQIERTPNSWASLIATGGSALWLHPEDGWSFELAERPEPPLKDGVYQKGNALLRRRDGRWFFSDFLKDVCQDDAYYRRGGWQRVGPERVGED